MSDELGRRLMLGLARESEAARAAERERCAKLREAAGHAREEIAALTAQLATVTRERDEARDELRRYKWHNAGDADDPTQAASVATTPAEPEEG